MIKINKTFKISILLTTLVYISSTLADQSTTFYISEIDVYNLEEPYKSRYLKSATDLSQTGKLEYPEFESMPLVKTLMLVYTTTEKCMDGKSIEKEILEFNRLAVSEKIVSANKFLGYLYGENFCPEIVDPYKVIFHFKKAAEMNDSYSVTFVGNAYLTGTYVDENIDSAVYWFMKGDSAGIVQSTYNLGTIALSNPDYRNLKQPIDYFLKAAKNGHQKSMWNLYVYFTQGKQVTKNLDEARKWLIKAADSGFTLAESEYGRLLMKEDSINNKEKYLPYLVRAAEKNDAKGQFFYGYALAFDAVDQESFEKAEQMLMLSVNQGYESARLYLATFYINLIELGQTDYISKAEDLISQIETDSEKIKLSNRLIKMKNES